MVKRFKFLLVMVVSLLTVQGYAVDIMDQLILSSGRKNTVKLQPENGVITVNVKKKSSIVFMQKNDFPPKGSVVNFKFTMKADAPHEISYRYSCKLKNKDFSFLKVKTYVKDSPKEYTYSALWKFGKEDMATPPKFVIMLWKPGVYTITSFEYSYGKVLKEGETTLPHLAGSVPLTSPEIVLRGTRYIRKYPDHIETDRFRSNYFDMEGTQLGFSPTNARSTTGIMLAVCTDSSRVTFSWGIEPQFHTNVLDFGVLLNGKLQPQTFKTRLNDRSKPFNFTVKTGATKGKPVLCEVTYPTHSNPYLLGIKLENGGKLYPVPESKKRIYVALGDSITQGTGQKGATYKTYAWQLAHMNNLQLYNLAVGGGKVSVKAGEMLVDWPRIDLITILIGFNDCMGGGRTVEQYYNSYSTLLDTIRKTHPETRIICITPTYPIDVKSKKTGIALNEFRKAVVKLVEERKKAGDNNIFLVHGEKLTPHNKKVHFTPEEATAFAKDLSKELNQRKLLDF